MREARYKGRDTLLFITNKIYEWENLNNGSVAIYNEQKTREVWGLEAFYKSFNTIAEPIQIDPPKEAYDIVKAIDTVAKRTFDSGATRDTDEGKLDYEGFLSPPVLEAYAEYMHKNRQMADGTLRDGDNWQKGIPKDAYMKSMYRHFFDVWKDHRGYPTKEDDITNLSALLFNVMGMLHEKLKDGQI